MSNYTDLVKVIKKAALDAVESNKPVNVVFGAVTSASPLKIRVDHKIVLTSAQLVLSRNVTDYDTSIIIEDGEEKKVTIHNKLKKGEEVILIRQQSGQKYIVLDRLG